MKKAPVEVSSLKKKREVGSEQSLESSMRQLNMDSSLDLTRKSMSKDVEQRQKLIDQLLLELEIRTSDIKKLGQNLYSLREINGTQQATIEELKSRVQEAEIHTTKLLNTVDIEVVPHDELCRRYAYLADKLQSIVDRNRLVEGELGALQNIEAQKGQLESQFIELREAHTAQQAYVLSLQESLQKTMKFKSVIQKQESVIQKLEQMLKDVKPSEKVIERGTTQDIERIRILAEENSALKDRLLTSERDRMMQIPASGMSNSGMEMLQTRISDLLTQLSIEKEKVMNLQMKQRTMPEFGSHAKDDSGDIKYIMRAERAEARAKSLEEELVNSAKSYGRQIAQLKAELGYSSKSSVVYIQDRLIN